jgi:transposase
MRVGVDLAKNVFQVHGVDGDEKPIWRRRLSRKTWLNALIETLEPGCEIGMEAGSSAHHWATAHNWLTAARCRRRWG